jgi:hypothetical protein
MKKRLAALPSANVLMAWLLLGVLGAIGLATAARGEETPVPATGPVRVEVSVAIVDVDGVDTVTQSFEANVFVEYRWKDPALAHGGPHAITKPLTAVWNPRMTIVNRQRVWPMFPEVVEIAPNGDVIYRQVVWGSFSQPLNLQAFPFDQQSFTVQLAAVGYRSDGVELVDDGGRKTGVASHLSLPDWEVLGWTTEAKTYEPVHGKGGPPGFTFAFEAKRKQGYFVAQIIVPLILIVMMSWVIFWVDPKESGTDIGVAVTCMLTLIAYRFAIGKFLPVISYMTRLDYFILFSTFLVFASLIESVLTSLLARRKKMARAIMVDRVSRFFFPAVFVLIIFQSLVWRIWW